MPWFRATFLIFVLLMSSGYRFRCILFCSEQTSTQADYVEQRDRCREYAELKLDMSLRGLPQPVDGKVKKTQLVSLFNECMGNNGWNIENKSTSSSPAGASAAAPAPAAPITAASQAAAQASSQEMVNSYQDKSALSRSAECMFARHAALNSSIAAARAKACDLECAQRMSAAPDAPRPAACPSDVDPDPEMARGVDKE